MERVLREMLCLLRAVMPVEPGQQRLLPAFLQPGWRIKWTLSPFLVAASSGLGEEALAGEASEAAAGDV
ncbi:hypothetical protein, partial [Streptomyces sp. NPDC057426]|uniref:hypothetical protein n=1 Tax=Streptomyces sp. NPDC057426 TaxID=3346128 RepID=UPI0036A12250